MKKYSDVRPMMRSGDVLLCKRRGLISIAIRVLTAESFNHAALIVERENGLWVSEMREGKGYQSMPLSQWLVLNKKAEVFWGMAPASMRGKECVRHKADEVRAAEAAYSYWTLVTVWVSQLFHRSVPNGRVCSTFVQEVAAACGSWRQLKAADPGDLIRHFDSWTMIEL